MNDRIKAFNFTDSRTGGHSYSGWHEGYTMCNGLQHFVISRPMGMLAADQGVDFRFVGLCNQGECQKTKKVVLWDRLEAEVREVIVETEREWALGCLRAQGWIVDAPGEIVLDEFDNTGVIMHQEGNGKWIISASGSVTFFAEEVEK